MAKASQRTELVVLSCILKDPGWIAELSGFLKSFHFDYAVHQKIFSGMLSVFNETQTLDANILVSKMRAMGIKDVEGIEIDDYVDVVQATQVDPRNRDTYIGELLKFFVLRNQREAFGDISGFINKNWEKPLIEIQSEVEKRVSDALSVSALIGVEDEGIDPFGDAEAIMKEIAASGGNPGIPLPLPVFSKWYGELETGESYIFAAPPKGGKSTWLSAIVRWAMKTPNVKVLILDTELPTKQIISRNLASLTGVKEVYFRKGTWTKDPVQISKAEKAFENYKKIKGRVIHHYVPGKTTEEIVSMSKRWHSRNIKEGEIALIVYDYIKLTGEDNASDLKEWELIGKKADALKMLSGTLKNTCVVSAVQLNEQGSVSQSARIRWFSSFVFHLVKKTPEELGSHGSSWGTHRLIEDVARHQGEEADESGPVEIVRGNKKEFVKNCIFIDINNFTVSEKQTYRDYLKTLPQNGKLTPRNEKAFDIEDEKI